MEVDAEPPNAAADLLRAADGVHRIGRFERGEDDNGTEPLSSDEEEEEEVHRGGRRRGASWTPGTDDRVRDQGRGRIGVHRLGVYGNARQQDQAYSRQSKQTVKDLVKTALNAKCHSALFMWPRSGRLRSFSTCGTPTEFLELYDSVLRHNRRQKAQIQLSFDEIWDMFVAEDGGMPWLARAVDRLRALGVPESTLRSFHETYRQAVPRYARGAHGLASDIGSEIENALLRVIHSLREQEDNAVVDLRPESPATAAPAPTPSPAPAPPQTSAPTLVSAATTATGDAGAASSSACVATTAAVAPLALRFSVSSITTPAAAPAPPSAPPIARGNTQTAAAAMMPTTTPTSSNPFSVSRELADPFFALGAAPLLPPPAHFAPFPRPTSRPQFPRSQQLPRPQPCAVVPPPMFHHHAAPQPPMLQPPTAVWPGVQLGPNGQWPAPPVATQFPGAAPQQQAPDTPFFLNLSPR